MALRIRFYYSVVDFGLSSMILMMSLVNPTASYAQINVEPVTACVVTRGTPLTLLRREQLAHCLAWENDPAIPLCHGSYSPITVAAFDANSDAIQIKADNVSLYAEGRSRLSGHVEVHQNQRIVNAKTAYVYRDAKTNQVTRVELLGEVHYQEPGRLMIARKVTLNPQDKSGTVNDAIYRFDTNRAQAVLPAWGRASLVERFANKKYQLHQASYSTCLPHHESWRIEARDLHLDTETSEGVAKHAVLRVGDVPVFYSPYLTFPLSNARKSGFLMPLVGYTNVGGFDAAVPYYWNMAPNYDSVITPHVYTRRGVMLGDNFRYLTSHSEGVINAQILPQDHAFAEYLANNSQQFPQLEDESTDRWSLMLRDTTQIGPNLSMTINYQQVSDNYYLQDFSTNLAVMTQNQLLRQGDLTYTTDHWLMRGMLQGYQTLHPINQSPIEDAYERLPQLSAQGGYYELPYGANVEMLGQFDYFQWPMNQVNTPQGPRYHLNPVLSLPQMVPWGFLTPAVQVVENYYDVHYGLPMTGQTFNRSIPRYSVDGGLFFERSLQLGAKPYTQTLEPRVFYLNVPYHDQTPVPVYESAYMIFNTDQLFRSNRFSGFDRIGDANQLAYGMTTRWISDTNGLEKASLTVGQIAYFTHRRVGLCYNTFGSCVDDPWALGFVSPEATRSPIASHGTYRFNAYVSATADYVWDGFTQATNNGNLNLHYQSADDQVLTLGYTYLVNGNLLPTANGKIQDNALHQASVAYATPLTEQWSLLGAYSYNISKAYSMMGLLGVQYDNCCWAARLMGGRTFMSLTPDSLQPQYNNNVYFQVLLKGLGSMASSNPSSVIRSNFPGYRDLFGSTK